MNGKLRNMASIYLYDENNRILLLYRVGSRVVNNAYIGTAGGHFEKEELNDSKSCILRELREETGLTINDISNPNLKYITLRYKNDEIRQNYYYFAKIINPNKKIQSSEGKLKWFKCEEILELDMPHTAKYVIEHYIKEGRNNNKIYGGVATSYGVEFTELKQI